VYNSVLGSSTPASTDKQQQGEVLLHLDKMLESGLHIKHGAT
jgi:hypothetical protein